MTLIPLDGSVAVDRHGVGGLDSPMTDLALSDSHIIVTLENGRTEFLDTLYVALGTTARTGLAASLGCHLTEDGRAAVAISQGTNVRGVYAIGDISDELYQIAVAMGQSAVAATAIHNALPRID